MEVEYLSIIQMNGSLKNGKNIKRSHFSSAVDSMSETILPNVFFVEIFDDCSAEITNLWDFREYGLSRDEFRVMFSEIRLFLDNT